MSELFTENIIPELTLNEIIAQGGVQQAPQAVSGGSPMGTQDGQQGTSIEYLLANLNLDNRTFHSPTIIGGIMRDTEILIKKNDGTNIFSLVKSGADIGDVVIGDYAGGTGAKWDESADIFDIKGTITATGGTIGGWTIASTTLSATGIILDAGNQSIRSSNYASGVFGTGFSLDSNLLEVGNIACRGLIRTAVFQKDVVNVMGGNFAVLDGDVLDEDMSADD